MLRNYLRVAFRNLLRNKLYFGINILGLGVAVACCVIAYLNYAFGRSFDFFQEAAALQADNDQGEYWPIVPSAASGQPVRYS